MYTFYLRDGLTWSDGEPVTAHDYEYAWKRACSPEMASPYAFLMTDYIKALMSTSAAKAAGRSGGQGPGRQDPPGGAEAATAYFLNLMSWFTYMPCREDMASTGEAGKRIPPNASPTARSCWRSTRWAPTFC